MKKKRKKTAEELDMFIRMTILGLRANPFHSNVGDELQKMYEETFGTEDKNNDKNN